MVLRDCDIRGGYPEPSTSPIPVYSNSLSRFTRRKSLKGFRIISVTLEDIVLRTNYQLEGTKKEF